MYVAVDHLSIIV